MSDRIINLGQAEAFNIICADKTQALKPLEESAEVFGAWQIYENDPTEENKQKLIDECADVLQATANLLYTLKVFDMEPALERCTLRNEARGRY